MEVAGTVCDADCSIFSQTVDRQPPPTADWSLACQVGRNRIACCGWEMRLRVGGPSPWWTRSTRVTRTSPRYVSRKFQFAVSWNVVAGLYNDRRIVAFCALIVWKNLRFCKSPGMENALKKENRGLQQLALAQINNGQFNTTKFSLNLTFQRLLVNSLTFPWELSNSLTFPGFLNK